MAFCCRLQEVKVLEDSGLVPGGHLFIHLFQRLLLRTCRCGFFFLIFPCIHEIVFPLECMHALTQPTIILTVECEILTKYVKE